jgi:hypothetical protein
MAGCCPGSSLSRQIARHLGWGPHAVQRYARAATWQELADGRWQGQRPSKLDPFKRYLDRHADESRGSMTRLLAEITVARIASFRLSTPDIISAIGALSVIGSCTERRLTVLVLSGA